MTEPNTLSYGRKIVVPQTLRPGDTVAVVAPSGPVDPPRLEKGIQFLESHGFFVVRGPHVEKCDGYLAGTDEQRCRDLNEMMGSPDIRAIFFARGGYGAMRLLDTMDCSALAAFPKFLMGMSDITSLQMSVFARCGLVTLSGPMPAGQMARGLDALSEDSFLRSLTQPLDGLNLIAEAEGIRVLRPGIASGHLLGGCLSLISSLIGTPHCPDFANSILFVEEVHEAPYRIDRMLSHLKLAQVLDKVEAIVAGHVVGPKGTDLAQDMDRILLDLTRDSPIPIIAGVPHGHKLPNVTIPHGAPAVLNTEARTLTVTL